MSREIKIFDNHENGCQHNLISSDLVDNYLERDVIEIVNSIIDEVIKKNHINPLKETSYSSNSPISEFAFQIHSSSIDNHDLLFNFKDSHIKNPLVDRIINVPHFKIANSPAYPSQSTRLYQGRFSSSTISQISSIPLSYIPKHT